MTAQHGEEAGRLMTYEERCRQRRIALCARRAVRDVFDQVRAEFNLPRKYRSAP